MIATKVGQGIMVGMEKEFYDKDLKLITLEQYSKLSADLGYKVVATSRVKGGQVISSWLGSDQNSGHEQNSGATPLIFGTIFCSDSGEYADEVNTPDLGACLTEHQNRCAQFGGEF